MHSPYLFVYSSLRKGFRSEAFDYLSQNFEFVGEAHVRGKLLHNGSHPVGVATEEDLFIEGELYKLKDFIPFDFVIEQLDDYEGVNGDEDNNPTALYRRGMVTANIGGQNFDAWVYWYNGDTEGMPQINETDIIRFINKTASPGASNGIE